MFRSRCIRALVCAALVCASSSARSGEETVLSPTRLETPVDQVGSSVTVITAEEIERKQYRFVL
ncbi:MAG: hypothetical protein V3U03_03775, partial [Myxococcota bacterium]